jgi:hypothetical protein
MTFSIPIAGFWSCMIDNLHRSPVNGFCTMIHNVSGSCYLITPRLLLIDAMYGIVQFMTSTALIFKVNNSSNLTFHLKTGFLLANIMVWCCLLLKNGYVNTIAITLPLVSTKRKRHKNVVLLKEM